jgi:hypothetical protein
MNRARLQRLESADRQRNGAPAGGDIPPLTEEEFGQLPLRERMRVLRSPNLRDGAQAAREYLANSAEG